MAPEQVDFAETLPRCEKIVGEMGLFLYYNDSLDPFFKGDLDGKRIFISASLANDEKLFNLLHLAGHSIQWNVDESLRSLGAELHINPDDALLKRLQTYEWEANCYALSILHLAGITHLDKWLTEEYILDMFFLTHFYKTGEKLKHITEQAKEYPFRRDLKGLTIPSFTPEAMQKARSGIVLSF